EQIRAADVCLGIFGASAKAGNVIPNKVFQIVSCGKPVITRDSPAIRELLPENDPGVYLIPPADADALLAALLRFRSERSSLTPPLHAAARQRITPQAVGRELMEILAAPCRHPLFGLAAPELGWVPAPRYALRRARLLALASGLGGGRLLEIGPGAGAHRGRPRRAGRVASLDPARRPSDPLRARPRPPLERDRRLGRPLPAL